MVENPVGGFGGAVQSVFRAGVERIRWSSTAVIGFVSAGVIGGEECDGGNDGGGESDDGSAREI